MASLHAFQPKTLAPGITPMAMSSQRLGANLQSKAIKWRFIITQHLRLSSQAQYAISLNKPDTPTLIEWMEKIICAGQCSMLIVEDLEVDEMTHARLNLLSQEHNVNIINLTSGVYSKADVIEGPW